MYTEDTFFTDILCLFSSASSETVTCYLKTNLRLYIYHYILLLYIIIIHYIYIYTHTHTHTHTHIHASYGPWNVFLF